MNKELENYSIEELEAALSEKKRKQQEEEDKPIREGFLKEDLHLIEFDTAKGYPISRDSFLCPKSEIENLFAQNEVVLPKGSRFVEYNGDGWFDDIGSLMESMSSDWAEKYLENFKDLK